jgi:hypothetical protein
MMPAQPSLFPSASEPTVLRLAVAGGFTGAIYGFLIGWFYWFKFGNPQELWTLGGLCAGAIASAGIGLLLRRASNGKFAVPMITASVLGIGFGVLTFVLVGEFFWKSIAGHLAFKVETWVYLSMFVGGLAGGLSGSLVFYARGHASFWIDLFLGALVIALLFVFMAARFGG